MNDVCAPIHCDIIEDYDYDFGIVNNHIVYYNYYAQTPFFVLFLAIGIALGIIGCAILVILL